MPAGKAYTFKIPCNVTPVKGDAILLQTASSVNYVATYVNGAWKNSFETQGVSTATLSNGVLTVKTKGVSEFDFACFVLGPNH